jgi:hypothetical protein
MRREQKDSDRMAEILRIFGDGGDERIAEKVQRGIAPAEWPEGPQPSLLPIASQP